MQDILTHLAAITLTPLVTPPVAPFGFGTDLDCADDLTDTFGDIDGSDPLAVAQANYRRLRTARGEVVDAPDYGFDLDALLQAPLTDAILLQIPSQVESQLLEDDRNEEVSCTLNRPTATDIVLDVQAISAVGPYTLTLALTDSDVLLREIRGT